MSKAATTPNVVTPEFRVSYPSLFEARENKLNGKMEFSVVALFAKGADLSGLKAEAERVVRERWGDDKTKWPKNLRSPFRDQGERDSEGYVEGAVFISLKSSQAPGIVDGQRQAIIDPHQIYAGCYGRASVRAYAYPKRGVTGQTPGVAFGLQHFQKIREGEPLSSRGKAEDAFEPIAGAQQSNDGAGSVFD